MNFFQTLGLISIFTILNDFSKAENAGKTADPKKVIVAFGILFFGTAIILGGFVSLFYIFPWL